MKKLASILAVTLAAGVLATGCGSSSGTLTEISKKWYGQDTAPEDDKFEETIN